MLPFTMGTLWRPAVMYLSPPVYISVSSEAVQAIPDQLGTRLYFYSIASRRETFLSEKPVPSHL